MITVRIDSILKAVAIERRVPRPRARLYTPSGPSLLRVIRLTTSARWVYRPCSQLHMHVWQEVQL